MRTMTEQLKLIAERIRNMREILDLTPEEVAVKSGMSLKEYLAYEAGESDFSFSHLHNIAKALGIDITDLLTGESPRLSHYILTRNGDGHSINRNAAYNYKHLALNFQNKLIQPFLVTLEPETDSKEKVPNQHAGQEFDYVLSGTLMVYLDGQELILGPGDSLFYDSSYPHAMYALEDKQVTFLAVVTE